MKVWKRGLSMLMTVSMILSLLPLSALATEPGEEIQATEEAMVEEPAVQEPEVEVLASQEETAAEESEEKPLLEKPVRGTCGEHLTWVLSTSGTLTISGTGPMYDYKIGEHAYGGYYSTAPWYEYRECILSAMVSSGVTSIGNAAFAYCSQMARADIPYSVTSIGEYAFYYCNSLTDVAIPSGVVRIGKGAFTYCVGIKEIDVPSGVTTLEGSVFSHCTGLESIDLYSGLETIGMSVFSSCTSLTSISIPDSVTEIGSYAFQYCSNLASIQLPSGMTTVWSRAFAYCTGLKSIVLPSGVTSIEDSAFFRCDNLESINLEEGLVTIGESAFASCKSLTSVVIPTTVEKIDHYAFQDCTGLTGVKIPANSTYLGGYVFSGCTDLKSAGPIGSGCDYEFGWTSSIRAYAFQGCTGLTSVVIPEGINWIQDKVFESCINLTSVKNYASCTVDSPGFASCTKLVSAGPIGSGCSYEFAWEYGVPATAFLNCTGLREVTLPQTMRSIGSSAFSGCTSLGSIYIPSGVEEINPRAFENCTLLEDLHLPLSLKVIGTGAFMNCSSIEMLEFPVGLTQIGLTAFSGCEALKEVFFNGDPPSAYALTDKENASFPYGTVLYYPWGGTSWEESEAFDAKNMTWNGYPVKMWSTNTLGLTPLHGDPILINGGGEAAACYRLSNDQREVQKGVEVSYLLNGVSGSAVTDENGVFQVPIPEAKSGFYTMVCQMQEEGGTVETVRHMFSVKVMPISYVQTWTGTLGVSMEAGIGAGIGVSVGAASATANLIQASAKAGVTGQFSLKDRYEDGNRSLELNYTYDPSIGGEFKSGVSATLPSVDIHLVNASAGASYHDMTASGLKIQNYDPTNESQIFEIGFFSLQAAMRGVNSVYIQNIYDLLGGVGNTASRASQIVLEAGASIGLSEPGGGFSLAAGDSTVVYSVTEKKDMDANTSTKTTELTYDAGGGVLKDLVPGSDSYLAGGEAGNSIQMEVTYDQNDRAQSLSYQLYEEGKKDFAWDRNTRETSKKVTYNKTGIYAVTEDNSDLREYIWDREWFISPPALVETAGAALSGEYLGATEYTQSEKQALELKFPLALNLGVNVGVELSGSFVDQVEYEDKTGVTFGGREYITSESFLTLDDVVAMKKTFGQVMQEPVAVVAAAMAEIFTTAANNLKDGIINGLAYVKSRVGELYAEVKRFVNPMAQSYAILAVESSDLADTNAAVAVTVGDPYVVNIYTDSTMETAASEGQVGEAGVTLTLSYNTAMLTEAGVSADADLYVYRFDFDRNMYICQPGSVQDRAASTVTVTITQSGEYILATDNASPLVSDFEVSNETPTPTIYALVSDLSGIGAFEFWIDDGNGILVDTAILAQYYDPASGLFTYPVQVPLAHGQHTAYFQTADTLGNANSEPFAFTFSVDAQAPVISDVIVSGQIGEDAENIPVTASVTDDDQLSHVFLLASADTGETSTLTMTDENGVWSGQIPDAAGKETLRIQVVAYDLAGNRSESRVYTLASDSYDGVTLSGEWNGAGQAAVTVTGFGTEPVSGRIFCVAYDGNGRMLGVASQNVELNGRETVTKTVTFDCGLSAMKTCKVMLLDVSGGFAPICQAELF